MLKQLITWFISLFERDLSTITKEETKPLKMHLQFFADGDGDSDDDDDDSDDVNDGEDDLDDDDVPDLDELLKDRKFKKQYQAKIKEQLGKRMRKFEGVDPEEFRRLKEQAGKKKQKQDDEEDDEVETLKNQLSEKEKRIARAERAEKRALVKEYAVDNSVNPKLLARLINVDDIELDENGEPENLDDLYEELEEEFPDYFGEQDDDEEEDEEETTRRKKKKSAYRPGSRQKNNKKTKNGDPRALGAAKAAARHKKEDDK